MSDSVLSSWVHCNTCFMIYSKKDLFCLVNCKHIFCKGCLQTKVIQNDFKCPFCKKRVRHKDIDDKLDPALKAALDPDPYKGLETAVINLEMNIQQMAHLHSGISRSESQLRAFDKIEKDMNKEGMKMQETLKKVEAQNKQLEKLIADEERRAQCQPMAIKPYSSMYRK